MNQADMSDSQPSKLINHLKLIDDLWQKLLYVKWNPKSFAMLGRLAQDMVGFAKDYQDEAVMKLVVQLEQHIRSCLTVTTMPQESERQRLAALIDILHEGLATGGVATETLEAQAQGQLLPELLLITAEENSPLLAKLEGFGYRVRRYARLLDAKQPLSQKLPSAIILDADDPEGADAVLATMADLRAQMNLRIPLVIYAERNDMAARLEAMRAGSIAYFTKPIDYEGLRERLIELILPQTAQDYYRVLIVNDRPAEAWEIAGTLEEQGISSLVLIQPLQVLQEIHRFRPDLLILDLDIKETRGADLAQAISQHHECDLLPMILLCLQADLAHYVTYLDVAGATLMIKPTSTSYLCWEVKQRLRRSRSMRARLNALSNNDAVSGFFNRGRFMILLEQTLETLGLRTKSLAVLFVMLDNLRSIRDAAGVATADEMIAQAANRLRQILSPGQHAARFSDAVFIVMAPNLLGDPVIQLARRIRDVLETGYYKMGEQALLLRIDIGIAVALDRTQDHLMLVQRADSACGLAREVKSERIFLHQNTLSVSRQNEVSSRSRMLEQVREIVEQERLWLVFQPIVSMRGEAFERYEILLRLRDREGNEVVPGSVFGVVYNHQLGLNLDRWVIEHTLDMLRQRRTPITVFIKVLPVTLQDRTLSAWLRERLKQFGVEAERIVFEVAESTAERSLRDMFGFLGGIKLLGCGFCLDRFGRGSDSLALLKNLGADYVKLDMYFVNGLGKDQNKQAQLKELVQNLEALGAATIVGGVEDVKAMPVLWSLGVDLIQGFFLQQPYREMSYDFANSIF
jgi:diguanylate cyclase (GGDEF)-like protein